MIYFRLNALALIPPLSNCYLICCMYFSKNCVYISLFFLNLALKLISAIQCLVINLATSSRRIRLAWLITTFFNTSHSTKYCCTSKISIFFIDWFKVKLTSLKSAMTSFFMGSDKIRWDFLLTRLIFLRNSRRTSNISRTSSFSSPSKAYGKWSSSTEDWIATIVCRSMWLKTLTVVF